MSTPDPTRPLPFGSAARGVFQLSLDSMVWSRRSLFMSVLLALPLAFAALYRATLVAKLPARITGFDLYGIVVALYYIRNVLPLAALFYATSLIADEVEGKTITYLLTRPIQRAAILGGKFAAYLVTTLVLTLPFVVLTFFLLLTVRGLSGISSAVPDLFRDMAVSGLTLLSYGALFTLFGVFMRRPMIPGLLFLFGWELLANMPGYVPRLTLTAYLRSLVTHHPAEEGLGQIFGQVLPAALCLEVLGGAVIGCLALSFWIFSTREFVLDQ